MNLYLLFIIIISLFGIEFFFSKFNTDYLSRENTSCIKGIFILIVFFSRLTAYIGTNLPNGNLMLHIRDYLGQLMVTMFLFYSGFGVYESIQKKKNYIDNMPKKRILKTLFNFIIAVLTFLIINEIMGVHYDTKTVLFSLIGWLGIGNSNWYIFGIINMYIITYLSFKFFENEKKTKKPIILVWTMSIIFIFFMSIYRSNYWFNTILCYPLGISYAYHRENIEKYIMRNNTSFIIYMLLSIWSLIVLKKYAINGYFYYELLSIVFCLVILGVSMKINFKSKILKWFGDNLFWVYILQRIPMLVLYRLGYHNHPYRFALASFIITIILAIIYNFGITRLHKLIFKIFNKGEKNEKRIAKKN